MATEKNRYNPQVAFHPSETLAERLEEMGMGSKEFAIRTGKPEKTISAVLQKKSSITPEMAVQFEHVLKIPAHFWLNKQRSYDEYLARIEQQRIFKASIKWARAFPYADMVKKGWVPAQTTILERTAALLAFFGVSNCLAWENYYLNQELKVAFRISLAPLKESHAISAWLRQGELQAAELSANNYSEKKFKDSLPKIKELMANHPKDFYAQLQQICLKAGVKVVHTPCIKKAPINGCTRWLNDTPLIQLSGRYNRNDVFWFTFFHEAGHILLHGKKDIFVEIRDCMAFEQHKEEEANGFAVNWTLSKEEEQEIIRYSVVTEKDIVMFSEKFNTHPAIIIGRLQHDKLIPYSLGKKFFEPVVFNEMQV
jgi:addiction module HigA family antidote